MTLGNIIKEYRTKYDLSMDAFSERSGISKSYISLLEKNKHPKTGKGISPSIQCIKQAAVGMNMDFDTLFGMLDGNVTIECSYENNNSNPSSHVSESSTYNATFSKLLSPNEEEMIKKYRKLDQHGQDTINLILEREHQRCVDYAIQQADGSLIMLEHQQKGQSVAAHYYKAVPELKAAHNDSNDPAEIEKMMQDLENLKRPE